MKNIVQAETAQTIVRHKLEFCGVRQPYNFSKFDAAATLARTGRMQHTLIYEKPKYFSSLLQCQFEARNK